VKGELGSPTRQKRLRGISRTKETEEPDIMNYRHLIKRSLSAALILISYAGLVAPWAQAKSKKEKDPPKETGIYVISHLELPEGAVSNIQASDDLDRYTIELAGVDGRTVTLVDVNNPEKPKLVRQVQLPSGLEHSSTQVHAGNTALYSAPENPPAKADPHLITLVSSSDPAQLKTVKRFPGVTAIWTDRTRGLIYLADSSGLWILQIYTAVDPDAVERADDIIRSALSGG
jgi:hypothetical protein